MSIRVPSPPAPPSLRRARLIVFLRLSRALCLHVVYTKYLRIAIFTLVRNARAILIMCTHSLACCGLALVGGLAVGVDAVEI